MLWIFIFTSDTLYVNTVFLLFPQELSPLCTTQGNIHLHVQQFNLGGGVYAYKYTTRNRIVDFIQKNG